jgi:phosphate transport system substrate-binding protein
VAPRRSLSIVCLSSLFLAIQGPATPLPASARPAVPVVQVSGSSTVFPIVRQAIRGFQASGQGGGVNVALRETGTSAGMRAFCAHRVPIVNASRPISSSELRSCARAGVSFIELPIAFDALTVVVHPRNSWARSITPEQLARLWGRSAQGRVVRWNQVNPVWPARPIHLCGPGSDSGTYDYFNKAINGSSENSRSDYKSSEDDRVLVKCVASDANALGYFGYSYYAGNRNRLRALAIVGPRGSVAPSPANVRNERYIPLSRPLFLYVNDRSLRQRPEVRRFVTHTVQRGLRYVDAAGAISLPPSTYRLVESKLWRHVLGTSFGGDLPVGLTIGQALRRSFDQVKRPGFR